MKAETALNLVMRFSALTQAIKAMPNRIGAELEKCQGLKGFRHETEPHEFGGETIQLPTARSNDDEETHLKGWYTPDTSYGYDGEGELVYTEVGEDERAECPHCYAAHLVIQERKTLRLQLGAVKAAMTRSMKVA